MTKKMTKKAIEKLGKDLFYKPKLAWDQMTQKEREKALKFSEGYKKFLDEAKTEREAVQVIERHAVNNGFKNIDYNCHGNKFYKINRNKNIALAVIGDCGPISGTNIIASHLDSPRLDLKQNPLYEDTDMAFLKTHYYGGIRKYQWLSRPLAIHGTMVTKFGSPIDICIGEDESDPIFTICDLLPHLAQKSQGSKKLSEAFEGEKLNLLVGSLPLGDDKIKDRFKLAILHYLFSRYEIYEENFISAEIEIVPAGKARDVGFDRSLVGAYGQDDRICAWTSLKAILELEKNYTTAIALFIDKEEIGSEGNTGIKSSFLQEFISDLGDITEDQFSERNLRKCLKNSMALSADVNVGLNPDYKEVHEPQNAAKIGYGVCMTKFTGSGGKSCSNDANAEFVGRLMSLFNKNKVVWQTGELGKIDEGGGGTIAKFLAVHGMEVIDCGPAILSMHSPVEVASKTDIYMAYKAYCAFYYLL